jgi:hypothetical protein
MAEGPGDCWDTLFEADDLSSRVAILRALVKSAAENDTAALTLLLPRLPAVDVLLADVQAALGQRN